MSDLRANLDQLHISDDGAERIRQNLKMEMAAEAIVSWCRESIRQADVIIGQGKNMYVYRNGVVITVHEASKAIITAHPVKPKIRPMKPSEYGCLPEFLYQSIFIPEGVTSPPRDIIRDPQIFAYIKDFGSRAGDLGVAAEQNGQIIGAAWTRLMSGFGHIDEETPELAISILPEFRGLGVGTKLMKKLFSILRADGFTRLSLSVQKNNPALAFYEGLGFRITQEKPDHVGHEDCIMMKDLI